MTLVTAKDVKLLLHCDDQYIHRCRKAGMPYHRVNGKIKYDMAEVYAWHRENGREVIKMRQKLILTKPEFVMACRLRQFGFALPRIGAELRGLRIDMKKAPAAGQSNTAQRKKL